MHVLQAAALLAALLAPAGASPQILAPPRGTLGPGTGASTDGGPGDRSPSAGAFSQPWRRWWDFNQDPYLARLRSPAALPVRAALLAEISGIATVTNAGTTGAVVAGLQAKLEELQIFRLGAAEVKDVLSNLQEGD